MRQGRCIRTRLLAATTGLLLAPIAIGDSPPGGRFWDVTVRQFEWQNGSGPDAYMWDVTARLGSPKNRLWIRDEGGRHVAGAARDNRLELLWGHPVDWRGVEFEILLGARHDSGTTPDRSYGALGIQMQAPLGIRFEATGYMGDGSRSGDDIHSGYRLQAERDWNITERLTLALRLEHELWNEDHVRYSEGHGPSMWSAGLRLRHELTEKIAPYLGFEWFELLGDTGQLAIMAGEEEIDSRFVAGLRLQF